MCAHVPTFRKPRPKPVSIFEAIPSDLRADFVLKCVYFPFILVFSTQTFVRHWVLVILNARPL